MHFVFSFSKKVSADILIFIVVMIFCHPVNAGGGLNILSYTIPVQDETTTKVSVFTTIGGVRILLKSRNTALVYDGRNGLKLSNDINSSEIIRTLEFVSASEARSSLLGRFGCVDADPGCTSPQDSDYIIKMHLIRQGHPELKISFLDLTRLKEKFATALSGETAIVFDEEEKQTLEDLLNDDASQGTNSWRDLAIDSIYGINSLENLSRSRKILLQLGFAINPRIYRRLRINGADVEETLLDIADQKACRLLGAAIVRNYPVKKSDNGWLALAMQEALINQCRHYSVQFRLGLFDTTKQDQITLGRGLVDLACRTQSIDYWCAGLALEGNSCQDVPLACGSTTVEEPPRRGKIDVAVVKPGEKKIRQTIPDSFALLDLKEVAIGLLRDKQAIGLAYYADPPISAVSGRFKFLLTPNEQAKLLLKSNSYQLSITFLLEIAREDSCSGGFLFCPRTTGAIVRRVERITRHIVLGKGESGSSLDLDFRKLVPEGVGALRPTLKNVRLIVEKMSPLELYN